MILLGHCIDRLRELPAGHVNCVVTSPPYWGLRDYEVPPVRWETVRYRPMPGVPEIEIPEWTGCLGLEPAPEMYVGHLVQVFREVRRVLRDDGTVWLNLGDTYVSTAPGTMGDMIHIEGTLEATKRARKIERRKIPTGLKSKDLVGIPWRAAFALQADGWYIRMDIIWHKPNPMPESVKDRPTKAHEYIFLLSKSKRYYYDWRSIQEPLADSSIIRLSQDIENQSGSTRANGGSRPDRPMKAVMVGGSPGTIGPQHSRKRSGNKKRKYGEERVTPGSHIGGSIPWEGATRNKRSVWTVSTSSSSGVHFATFPEKLIEPCILAGCPEGGIVLDPFGGSGTTAKVALQNRRECILIEQNPEYVKEAEKRTTIVQVLL